MLTGFEQGTERSFFDGSNGLKAVFAVVLFLAVLILSGCGGGGEGAVSPASRTAAAARPTAGPVVAGPFATNYLQITASDYPFAAAPTFYYSTDNESFWSIQANVTQSVTDIDSRTVIRIDIPKSGAPLPELNRTFSIESESSFELFPGSFLVLDGQQSTGKRVESGTITFTPESVMFGQVSGSFDVVFTDYDSPAIPSPRYFLRGVFSFRMGGYGPAA